MLPQTPWGETPRVVAIEPADGAANVRPRSSIAVTFSGPMNRSTTLRALRITPTTPGQLRWSDDNSRLIFEPDQTLTPAITYTISLDQSALGRLWSPLAAPAAASFATAPLPAVIAALPANTDVPTDSSLAVIFSV